MTQCDQVLAYLQENIAITDTVARELFGINRLAARIWDLRQRGTRSKAKPCTSLPGWGAWGNTPPTGSRNERSPGCWSGLLFRWSVFRAGWSVLFG